MKTTIQCIILVMIIFSIDSCKDDVFQYRIQPELQSYMNSFYREANKRGIQVPKANLILEVVDGLRNQPQTPIGVTQVLNNGQVTIKIDKQHFDNADTLCIEKTVFHELGHGYFCRKNHIRGISYMDVINADLACYGVTKYRPALRDSMLNELFSFPLCFKLKP